MLLIDRNVRWLEAKQITEADRKGAWSYPGPGGDNSNSQFAVLALYDAQSVGAKVKRQTWQLAADYWRNTQNDDGSWGYVPGDAGSGSMTCAGIGALATSTAALESGDATVEGGRVICCRPHKEDDALERAVDWLAQHFSVSRNPRPAGSGQACLYYYLYGLERAGRLTARRFIGDHDWYREGAEYLVHDQDPLSHYWQGNWHAEQKPHISTALALLFLAKGRRPVVMAKLEYGQPEHWNQHRRDAANLVAYTEKAWNLGLTWQTVNAERATVEDLLQSPVLYISGSRAIGAVALREQAPRLRRPRRVHLCRGLLRRFAPLRRELPQVDGRRVPRAGVQAAAGDARPSDLEHGGKSAARFAVLRQAVVGRVWLPHVGHLFDGGFVVLLGAGPARPADEVSRGGRPANRRCARGRHQRAHVRHEPRAEGQGAEL